MGQLYISEVTIHDTYRLENESSPNVTFPSFRKNTSRPFVTGTVCHVQLITRRTSSVIFS